MRADIVPGAIFPDYELSDHTAKRRKLPVDARGSVITFRHLVGFLERFHLTDVNV
jgi:hypothetical protein